MNQVEEKSKMEADQNVSRLLAPIDASYKPTRHLTKIPATSSIDEILEVLERDGGVILTDFISHDTLDQIDRELEPWAVQPIAENDSYDDFFGRKTLVIPGLVEKSETITSILDKNETIDQLLKILLTEKYPAVFEHQVEELVTEPLLSIALAFHVGRGSPRQALHRDDMVFCSKHKPNMKITENDGFSCFLAGTDITRENGGTMIIPGSHKWEHGRQGRPDEVTFLEMKRGSAFIFLSTVAHGAGYNTTDQIRKIMNLVFVRGHLRTEENQFLCNSRSKVLNMSPKMQTLLGFKKPPRNWLGMVENKDPADSLAEIYEKTVMV